MRTRQGVLSSLRQLLEEGYFHADPHPGNVVITKDGILAYFDFGMMSELRREYRIGLIRTVSSQSSLNVLLRQWIIFLGLCCLGLPYTYIHHYTIIYST